MALAGDRVSLVAEWGAANSRAIARRSFLPRKETVKRSIETGSYLIGERNCEQGLVEKIDAPGKYVDANTVERQSPVPSGPIQTQRPQC